MTREETKQEGQQVKARKDLLRVNIEKIGELFPGCVT